jgi:hypothetical protein
VTVWQRNKMKYPEEQHVVQLTLSDNALECEA